MSANQKQPAGGGPPNQRYSAALYQPLSQQQRTDAFHVPTQPYVPQQQPNQPGSQAQTLRGIAPTGPPNQSSTPPTNDLKVQQVSQQQSMNHMYVAPQQQVRGTQGPYYRSGPPNQANRMPSQHRGQQQIYQTPATQYVQMQMPVPTPMYIANAAAMQYYNGQRQFVPQATPLVYQGQPIPSQFTFSTNPTQTQQVSFPYFPPRQIHPSQQPNTVPPSANQPLPNIPMSQSQPHFQRQPNKQRRAKAIPIIDPDTGVDKLDELYEQANNSHPPSGESSARQTPQPSVTNANKEIQLTFAKQVFHAANDTGVVGEPDIHSSSLEPETLYHNLDSQSATQPSKHDLVQSSNLKVQAKEFVFSTSNTAKETTPIVSANCDAVEVTLPNKLMKDRESPAKGRKQKEQQQSREHRDSIKETPIREKSSSDNESSNALIVKPENTKTRETSFVPSANVVSVATATATTTTTTTTVVTPVQSTTNKDDKELVMHRDDKKNQKKDSKTETNVPNIESTDSANAAAAASVTTSPPAQPAQDPILNTKSKTSTQRSKDGQKQQPPASNQKQASASVPAPQPSKPNSKSSKKSELNQKGASKEGTDMDAFNDNNARLDAVNANINTANNEINANSDISNANNVVVPPGSDAANKKNHNAEMSTFRTEPKTLPKKIDITDIVKEKPKPIKSFPQQTETHDEIDRATPLSNDKIVQAKNEANAKVNNENNTASIIESRPELPYKEGQWAPNNLDGKKVYDKEFLLALRGDPASQKRPDNLPDIIIADDRGRLSEGRYSMSGSRTDFTPNFSNYGGKSTSQRGPPPKRNSQSGKVGGSGGKGSKSTMIKSISVRMDVKLHEVENAWRPARFQKGDDQTEEERKTEELYKKVRGVLNKLTPQKFDTLVSQVRELQIDTEDRLQGVIDLVFEKAVDEPNFSVAYALMCRELALMQVPAASSTEEKKEVVQFRKLLVTRCQLEFEKQSHDETVRMTKVGEIEECADLDKKKELQFELDEYDRKLRMKSVGNIRFIGELFKQQMLTTNIMMRCLDNLLENKDEESLECLCKLLTTIGKELERGGNNTNNNKKGVDLSPIFNSMRDIVERKDGKVNSRVRFMLQDVIDLRRNKWIPRRQDLNPKTIDQIQKEAENEQMNIQAMNSVPLTPRKEDRGSSAGANSERKRRNVSSDDGWQTASSRNSKAAFTVQSDKLKNKPPLTDEPLGSRQMFGNWSKGSNIKTDPSSATNTTNMYAALDTIDPEKRSSGSRSSKDPYSSKGSSLERSNYKQSYDGRGSRSGSQHRVVEQQGSASPMAPPPTPVALKAVVPQIPVVYSMTDEQLERHVKNNLDEYLNDSCTIEEYSHDTQTTVPPTYLPRMVADGYLHVLERSSTARIRTGILFAKLIKIGTLPLKEYCIGLEEVLSQVDDLTIDIPMIWDYLAEILVYLIFEDTLSFSTLHKSSELIIQQGHGARLLRALFKLVVSEKGPNYLISCWRTSGLGLEHFMESSQIDSFINDNNLNFLIAGDTAIGQSLLTYEQIYDKLMGFFSTRTSFDDIVNWITANVGDLVKENRFVRVLVTTIFESSISRYKLVEDNLKGHYKLLQKYIDNSPNYELQCLYVLQALIHKMEHPQGLLFTFCNRLYEDSIISQDSFIAWEASEDPAEQEGKGVALKQLTSFFTQLKENEEESGSSSDEA